MTKDRRLGKGLAALLGTPLDESEGGQATGTLPAVNHRAAHSNSSDSFGLTTSMQANAAKHESSQQTLELGVHDIDNNPFQPRRQFNPEEIASLAESLKEHQQLQPVIVRRVGDRFQLISGERRLRAAIHAGLKTVRAEVRDADDRLVAELAIVENLQRKDLNPIEKALSFRRYLDEHRCTQEEFAKRLKIDRSTIANLMRLLELPAPILDAVQSDRVSAGHARALLPLGEEQLQIEFAQKVETEQWSVRETERRVAEHLDSEDEDRDAPVVEMKGKRKRVVSPQIASLEQEFRRALGTKVEIRQASRGKGKIIVQFANADEFERLKMILAGPPAIPNMGFTRAA